MSTHPSRARPGNGRILATAIATALAAGFAAPASAVPIQTDNWSGSWDTTLSYGALWRVESPDCRLIANANGGCGRSANIDDGNLNFDTGIVSQRGQGDVRARAASFRDSWGVVRARHDVPWDWEAGPDQPHAELTDSSLHAGRSRAAEDARLLRVRALQHGRVRRPSSASATRSSAGARARSSRAASNLTNPVDVAQLRVPGAELKEALAAAGHGVPQRLPVRQTSASRPTTSTTGRTGAARPGRQLLLDQRPGRQGRQQGDARLRPVVGPRHRLQLAGRAHSTRTFVFVPRGDSEGAKDDGGQYGIALRYFADQVMGGMEFGFYYLRYHSRLPVVSGRTGTQAGFGNAAAVATAAQAAAIGLASGLSFDAAVTTATAQGMNAAANLGGDIAQAKVRERATIAANTFLSLGSAGRRRDRQCLRAGASWRTPRGISPSIPTTWTCGASAGAATCSTPASPGRARSRTSRIRRCRSTTSSCCSLRFGPLDNLSPGGGLVCLPDQPGGARQPELLQPDRRVRAEHRTSRAMSSWTSTRCRRPSPTSRGRCLAPIPVLSCWRWA
jgi:hypothetical protein